MKITDLLASLMKKKEEEPTLKFDVAFHHERATIRTADGGTFDDWSAVSDRWCIEHPSGYRILGPSFELIYLVNSDRLLLVQVSCAALIEEIDGQPLWQAASAPNATFITARKGVELLTNWRHKVSPTIKRLAEAEEVTRLERDAKPARSIELWANTPALVETTTVPRNREHYFSMAWAFATHATNLFKTLNRWRREGVVYDRAALDCARTFNRRFRPDTRRWLLEKKSPPPESLGIHELTWPADLQDAQKVIMELQSLIAIPLASAVAGFVLPELHDCCPNAAERKRGFEMLDSVNGDIARLAGTLMELLQQVRLKEHDTEQSSQRGEEETGAATNPLTATTSGEPEVQVPSEVILDLSEPKTGQAKRKYTKNAQQKIAEHWAEVKKSGNEELIGKYLTGAEDRVAKELFHVARNTLRESEFYKTRDEEAANWRRRNSKPPTFISDL